MEKSENRPSKKQRELLSFIDGFIKGYGYGPSYREIMRSLNYKSVSTVATHVDNLIAKGYLVKKDNSARSGHIDEHKQWLVDRTQMRIDTYLKNPDETKKSHAQTLIDTSRLLVDTFTADELQKKLDNSSDDNV